MRNFLHFTASGLRRTVLAPSFVERRWASAR